MLIRTTQTIVHFAAPFSLTGLDVVQAAGDYTVDHDDERIEGISWLAYRRVGTLMHFPAIGAPATTSQMLAVDPAELEDALQRDAALQSDPNSSAAR